LRLKPAPRRSHDILHGFGHAAILAARRPSRTPGHVVLEEPHVVPPARLHEAVALVVEAHKVSELVRPARGTRRDVVCLERASTATQDAAMLVTNGASHTERPPRRRVDRTLTPRHQALPYRQPRRARRLRGRRHAVTSAPGNVCLTSTTACHVSSEARRSRLSSARK